MYTEKDIILFLGAGASKMVAGLPINNEYMGHLAAHIYNNNTCPLNTSNKCETVLNKLTKNENEILSFLVDNCPNVDYIFNKFRHAKKDINNFNNDIKHGVPIFIKDIMKDNEIPICINTIKTKIENGQKYIIEFIEVSAKKQIVSYQINNENMEKIINLVQENLNSFLRNNEKNYRIKLKKNPENNYKNDDIINLEKVIKMDLVNKIKHIITTQEADGFHEFILTIKKKMVGSSIAIFTTNYDTLIEQWHLKKFSNKRISDGFNHKNQKWNGFGNYSKKIQLFKLHGSISWIEDSDGFWQHERIDRLGLGDNQYFMIYSDENYPNTTYKSPYWEIIEHFHTFMKKVQLCIVVGYSFCKDAKLINMGFYKRFNKKLKTIIYYYEPNEDARILENLELSPKEAKDANIEFVDTNTL